MNYTIEERVKMIELRFAGNSFQRVCDLFSVDFPDRPIPCPKTVRKLLAKFKETGSVETKRRTKGSPRLEDEIVLTTGKCFAPDCHHDYRFDCLKFTFPRDPTLKQQWISLIGRKDKEPDKYTGRLCSCHFEDSNRDNLPSIFIEPNFRRNARSASTSILETITSLSSSSIVSSRSTELVEEVYVKVEIDETLNNEDDAVLTDSREIKQHKQFTRKVQPVITKSSDIAKRININACRNKLLVKLGDIHVNENKVNLRPKKTAVSVLVPTLVHNQKLGSPTEREERLRRRHEQNERKQASENQVESVDDTTMPPPIEEVYIKAEIDEEQFEMDEDQFINEDVQSVGSSSDLQLESEDVQLLDLQLQIECDPVEIKPLRNLTDRSKSNNIDVAKQPKMKRSPKTAKRINIFRHKILSKLGGKLSLTKSYLEPSSSIVANLAREREIELKRLEAENPFPNFEPLEFCSVDMKPTKS